LIVRYTTTWTLENKLKEEERDESSPAQADHEQIPQPGEAV
jgi:hypothetical protein